MTTGTMFRACCALLLAGCASASKPPVFDPNDPAAIAAIDSIVTDALQGASEASADRVLAMAEGPGAFTFVIGDLLIDGLEPTRAAFRDTYASLARQDHTNVTRSIRLLTPDVAVCVLVGEGTYTDLADWTSPPVGLGLTLVFVRTDGRWQLQHVHQSVAF